MSSLQLVPQRGGPAQWGKPLFPGQAGYSQREQDEMETRIDWKGSGVGLNTAWHPKGQNPQVDRAHCADDTKETYTGKSPRG